MVKFIRVEPPGGPVVWKALDNGSEPSDILFFWQRATVSLELDEQPVPLAEGREV
jgi:hypothetical protein